MTLWRSRDADCAPDIYSGLLFSDEISPLK